MKRRRRSKQVATRQATAIDGAKPAPDVHYINGARSLTAVTEVLQALTELPSDRAKARVLRFVQDYFDEQHGH
jgi:hypothetical protein